MECLANYMQGFPQRYVGIIVRTIPPDGQSNRVPAKCNDLCRLTRNGKTTWGYVPGDIGLGQPAALSGGEIRRT